MHPNPVGQRLTRVLFLSLVVAGLMALAPARASAQQTMNCSSDDGRRHVCEVGPNRGIRMIRQRSGSPCQLGRTYGIERNRVWVDRGCRADFEVLAGAGGGYPPQNYPPPGGNERYNRGGGPSQTITCSSDDMNLHYCSVGGNPRSIRLVRQRSGSPCEQGRTYGLRGNQIWVNRGCRADFEVFFR